MYLFNKRSLVRNFKLFLISLGIKRIKSFDEILNLVKTSYDLECVLASFKYISDRKGGLDHWKDNERFIKEGGGDCEDFALLVHNVLERKGFITTLFILSGKRKNSSHAICYFKKDRDEGVFSNSKREVLRNFNIDVYSRNEGYRKYRIVDLEETSLGFMDIRPI